MNLPASWKRDGKKSQSVIDMTPSNIQDYWTQGIHVKSDGSQVSLTDVPQAYLNNIINKFNNQGVDTSILTNLGQNNNQIPL